MEASIREHLKLEEIGYMIPLSYPVKEIPIVTIFVKMYLKSQLDEFNKLFPQNFGEKSGFSKGFCLGGITFENARRERV